TTMPQTGIHSVTVPGAVAGWMALHEKFGHESLDTILSAAIAHAEQGFPVSEITASEWLGSVPALQADRNAAALYLPNGRAPAAGEIFRNPDLSRTLESLARDDGDAFYRGEIAEKIVKCSAEHGGAHTAADFADYKAEWVTPLTTNYRGWDVYEIPPNSQGIAALIMLNILEGLPLNKMGRGTVETLHTMIEAKKLAYADMLRHVGDPRFSKVPVEAMLSKAYARQRAALIDPRRAAACVDACHLPAHGGDTTYLCVVDILGNMVSLIQSNFANFGSGVVPEGTGFALQSRGGLFTFDRSHPNVLEPRKRPLQTVIPGFMRRDHLSVGFGAATGRGSHPRADPVMRSRWIQLLLGLGSMIVISSPQYVWTLFTQPLIGSLHASLTQIQITFSLLIVVQTFLSPCQGFVVDKFGLRALLSLGGALTGLSWVLAARAFTIVGLYLTYGLLGGIGTGIVYIVVIGHMVQWFPDRRGFATGIAAAGYGMGAILTTFPISETLKNAGHGQALARYGLIFMAVGVLAAQGLRTPVQNFQPATLGPKAAASHTRVSFAPRQMLRTTIFWLMFVMMTMMSTAGLMVTSQIAAFTRDFGMANAIVFGLP